VSIRSSGIFGDKPFVKFGVFGVAFYNPEFYLIRRAETAFLEQHAKFSLACFTPP
jgi:hypothetical protein